MYWRLILALVIAFGLRAVARRFRSEGSLWE